MAGFVHGWRGSLPGMIDLQTWKAKTLPDAFNGAGTLRGIPVVEKP